MVDECAGARWYKLRDKGILRCDVRHDARWCSAPTRHTIRKTFQFDAMPMHGGRLAQAIDHGNRHRLAATQHDHRSGNRERIGMRLGATTVQRVTEIRTPERSV